jgi:hypothetical protein
MDKSQLDINTGLPIFLLTNNHPEKFFEKSTYQFAPQAVTNIDKLKKVFFSPENVKYLQEKMIYEVLVTTNYKYKIQYQNEQDLRMIMETIYMNKTRNIGYALNEQLKELNDYVVKFCVPKIINELGVYLKYLEDINKPMELNELPKSTGNFRSTAALASLSYLNENIYLPNMESNLYYSTNGELNNMTPKIKNEVTLKTVTYAPSPWGTPSAPSAVINSPSYEYNPMSPPSSTDSWLPSAALFQDDPYYIRNSLLSPYALKPKVPAKTFPNQSNGLFSSAEGTDDFLPNSFESSKYANVN